MTNEYIHVTITLIRTGHSHHSPKFLTVPFALILASCPRSHLPEFCYCSLVLSVLHGNQTVFTVFCICFPLLSIIFLWFICYMCLVLVLFPSFGVLRIKNCYEHLSTSLYMHMSFYFSWNEIAGSDINTCWNFSTIFQSVPFTFPPDVWTF